MQRDRGSGSGRARLASPPSNQYTDAVADSSSSSSAMRRDDTYFVLVLISLAAISLAHAFGRDDSIWLAIARWSCAVTGAHAIARKIGLERAGAMLAAAGYASS